MPATTLRPNQGFTTKATVTRGDTQLVSWIIFSGHNSDSSNILEIHPKIGLELDHSFSVEGKFRLAAYHKEIQTKEDYQSTAELKHVDVEVKYNQLDGTKLLPKNQANFVSGDILRKDFPCVFEAKFLIDPASSDELSRLKFSLSDGSRNTLDEGSQAGSIFTFTPQNSNAKYTVTAEYTDEFGAVSTQSFSGTSKALSVKDITHGEQVVRPGTPMSFSVTKTQFNFSIKNDSDLPENESIKWNLDKVLVGTGRTINIPGSRLIQKKKYHIEAFVTSAIGKTTGTNTDGINNDWHFEVKDNIVEKIKIVKIPKMGTIGEFEIEETTFKNYDPAKDGAISWKVAGPETGTGSEEKFSKSFNLPGEYTISCNLGERPCKEPLKINIIEPMVTVDQCKWIDRDTGSGNIIKQAGLNQEVAVFVAGNGLDNEDITLDIYDDDSTGNNIVFTNTFKTTEKHKTGFYFPLTITQEIVDKIKKHGFADRGDLYFNLVRNGAETPIKNGDKKLGEFLRVTLDPQIINAYFCDANDTEQVFSSPLNGALYFKIYAINMVDKKVEINFLTESDAYWTWDDELKIGTWEDIKDKFKDEKVRDTKTATFDKKGEILVPVDLSKMGKPKNFIRLNAMVKILKDEETTEKQEEKGFYIKHTDLAILFPGATLPTMVENKGAVKVGRAEIDGGNKECVCKQYDLVWGKKIGCDERKKVVEVAKNLGVDPNWLMTVMALETAETFSPSIDNGVGYVGLIQFGVGAAKDVGTTQEELVKMSFIKQMDYVEKHLLKNKSKFKTLADLYLAVLYPSASGHGSEKDYVVLHGAAYRSNPLFFKEKGEWEWATKVNKRGKTIKYKKPTNPDGNTYVWEVAMVAQEVYTKGSESKAISFSCGGANAPTTLNAKEIITYHIYSNGKVQRHIPKVIKEEYKNKYKYVYHDKNNIEHIIGIGDFKTIKNTRGSGYGGKTVDLIDIRQFPSYSKGDVKFKIMEWNSEGGKRYYLNDKTLASFLGALLNCGFEDIVFNGFSNSEGGSGVSKTHYNGYNGDVRYLCKDKSGSNLHLDVTSKANGIYGWKDMDKEREITLINALHLFGWKKYYSWKFNGELLPYSTQLAHHNHHLHMYSYEPDFQEINEK